MWRQAMNNTTVISETNNFIVLDHYVSQKKLSGSYQSEAALEQGFVKALADQGYERISLKSQEAMLANVRVQLEALNDMRFADDEWERFVREYLDKPNEGIIEKTRKIHDNHAYDFVFNDGHIKNIYLLDKVNISRNKMQVLSQFEQKGKHLNRYDVTILVNGLPLVQIELKKRGVSIREAFNQVHRYSKESFNSENSLYKYLQIFVISNGTDTRYFANTTKRDKNSFDFTINWAKSDNKLIKDIEDFTGTFFQKDVLLKVLTQYSVFDSNDTLLIMRPYQIAATERILWKIKSLYNSADLGKSGKAGGYIWHTTGSGKTLTSFKAARLATTLEFIEKVFFVVDRKDLDYQTMKEYQRFSPNCVNGSDSTAGLKRNIEEKDNKIIVTTIQKLNNLVKNDEKLAIYDKNVVFIFDECHRSQFGEAQKNIKKRFKKFCQFGFTGTPIFSQNALGAETTESVFGRELHSYVITDAIRDEKVLKFKVDYNNVRPKFKIFETETNEQKLTAAENKEALQHPERIKEISRYILEKFPQKTHRLQAGGQGFNAMMAVSNIDAAKLYYEALNKLQEDSHKKLKIATIFSFSANEAQDAIGDIQDESFAVSAMNSSAKEFLHQVISDYNAHFRTTFTLDGDGFQNYYRDLAKRVRSREVDLLIVVGMFLTGFDAPSLNTLFVDKNLRYHGLIQAYSRTNRIHGATKSFGNIVAFRDLEQATIDAITLFGDKSTKNVVLEKSYEAYMEGYEDEETGIKYDGFITIVSELKDRFPHCEDIVLEKDKRDFVKLFGKYLRVENILQNYDEFSTLKAVHMIDADDPEAIRGVKDKYQLTDQDFDALKAIKMPSEREIQDYRSTYNDIRDYIRRSRESETQESKLGEWDDVTFEVDLLKTQDINLDYILELLFEYRTKLKNKADLIKEARRLIKSSLDNRAKEELFVDFMNQEDLEAKSDKTEVIEAFYQFAQKEQKREAEELIREERLKEEDAKRYIMLSLKREYASETGTALEELLPKMSPLNPRYLSRKKDLFQKMAGFVEKFKGIGGTI